MKIDNLITGIPRSGTTLITSLIAENQDAVVFSEPEWLKLIRQSSKNSLEFTSQLLNYISKLRIDIKLHKPIQLKINPTTQKLPTNYYKRDKSGNVVTLKDEEKIILENKFAQHPFYIKSNAQFTACLHDLINSNEFKIYCIIRNPISCIMSWRSLNIPVSQGNMKIAEKYSQSFSDFVSGSKDLLHKQVLIIDWFYREFMKHSDSVEIIKYEELLKDTHSIIGRITANSSPNIIKLASGNKSQHYDHSERQRIRVYLTKYCHHYKNFYENLDDY
jgi:hypothetical protein